MTWDEHNGIDLQGLSASVLIISDSLFSGQKEISEDQSGQIAIDVLSNFGFDSINLDYYPDELIAIKSKVENDVSQRVGLILLIGGTGIAERDVTIEAIDEIISKELPGFGEIFRRKSLDEIGYRALLSRTKAGTSGASLIVALPGSPGAVKTGLQIVEEIIRHAMQLLKRKG